jgi:hypothetical protein
VEVDGDFWKLMECSQYFGICQEFQTIFEMTAQKFVIVAHANSICSVKRILSSCEAEKTE